MGQDLSPVPYKTKVLTKDGHVSPPWRTWLTQLFDRVGGNNASTNAELESPVTTLGDTIYADYQGDETRLPGNSSSTRKFYTQTGSGSKSAAPQWNTIAGSDLPTPTSTALGGVKSLAAVSHEFLTQIGTDGTPAQAQPAFTDISGSVAPSQLPNPTATTLGGVESYAPVAHQFINTISTSGVPSSAQPAFTDISGVASPSQIPTPTASTIGGVESYAQVSHQWINSISTSGVPTSSQPAFSDISGIVAAMQLPTPTPTTLGGVESYAAVTHQFINQISTSGVPSSAQPAFTDISGVASPSQLPNPTASTLGGVESYAAVSHQWINQISTAGVPSSTQPGFSDLSGNIATTQMNSGTGASSTTFWRGDGVWATPSGGGGGGSGSSAGAASLQWVEAVNSATPTIENNLQVYAFASGLGQTIYAAVRVPSTYSSSSPIALYLPFYSPDTSGTALLQTITTLIRSGVDAVTTTTNQRTSTNTAITLGAGTASIPQVVAFDLTDVSGAINGVSVSAGDTIVVGLTRGTDTGTSDLKAMVYDAEVKTTTSGGGSSSGGAISLQWAEAINSATPVVENNMRAYAFASGLGQLIYAAIRVPSGYASSSPISLYVPFYSPDTSGTALIQTVSTLIRSGVDAVTSTTNQRTSTNSAITLGAGTQNIPQVVAFDVSDVSGKINGVSISAGDTVIVGLTRGSDTGSSDLKALVYDAEVKFS